MTCLAQRVHDNHFKIVWLSHGHCQNPVHVLLGACVPHYNAKKYDDEACHVAAEVGVSLKCCIIKTMTESTLVCRLHGLVKYVVENR